MQLQLKLAQTQLLNNLLNKLTTPILICNHLLTISSYHFNTQLPLSLLFSTINPTDTGADAAAVAVVAVGVAEVAEATNVNANTVGRTDYAVITEESATTRIKAIRLMQPLKIKWEATQDMSHDGVG